MFEHKVTDKNENELTGSPCKFSTTSNHDAPLNQAHSGKIGAKVIPVSPAPDSMDDNDFIEVNKTNSNNVEENSCNNNVNS